MNNGEIIIGDGGYVFAMEKRGYVKAGPWTPEATVEYPEAGNYDCKTARVQRYKLITKYCMCVFHGN